MKANSTLQQELVHNGFFVIRTPLLPSEALTDWSADLAAARAWESTCNPDLVASSWTQDVSTLRSRLLDAISSPEIRHALYIASPSLEAGIEHWKKDPNSKKGMQAERALVRYFERMSARSTPFGLFSGCSVGKIEDNGKPTTLALSSRSDYRPCWRLDFDYLFALTAGLRQDPALESELRYFPNSSLHRVADAWHYVESRMSKSEHTHHLVKIENDPYLEALIAAARRGATVSQLVAVVFETPAESNPSEAEATQYVLGIIRDNDILVSELVPLLTGKPPLDDIIEQLTTLASGAGFAESLVEIRHRLLELEKKGLGCVRGDYEAIISELDKLPAKCDPGKLFQVDMIKPVDEAVLGASVISELKSAAELLCRFGQADEPTELKAFREAFFARYELAMVPLMDALDDESGIGFGSAASRRDASPLLRGLQLHDSKPVDSNLMPKVHPALFRQIVESIRSGTDELELDVAELANNKWETPKLADAFCLTGTLVAESIDALRLGNFEFYLQGGFGPSGARMLGRFCCEDSLIEHGVREHLRREEAHEPEAVYAEIVYLPEGRIGNVLCRPVLREYEIPYLGRSGAPPERQLPIGDLLVGVKGDNIVLYSQRLGKQVIPRLTSAHGFINPKLSSVYRFLCCLQHQHAVSVPHLSWPGLGLFDHIPRLRVARIVLCPAQWRLSRAEVEAIGKEEGSRRFVAVQQLRKRRGLPRWIVFQESDNVLPVDLDNALSVDAFVHVLKRGSTGNLMEMYPPPDRLCVAGPEGSFYHELNVPFTRRLKAPTSEDLALNDRGSFGPALKESGLSCNLRFFPLGSEWIYLKLYGGVGVLDEILTSALCPVVREVTASAAASRWFLVRYADPQNHLRLRFNGEPNRLIQEVLPLLTETCNALLSAGKLHRIEFDVYQREVERYGGLDGVLAAEDLFRADSEAVLDILQELGGDEGLDARWRIGLLGIDQLLGDFDFDEGAKRTIVSQWRDSFQKEFNIEAVTKRQLSDKFRGERRKLETLLDDFNVGSLTWKFAKSAFERRSARNREVAQRLRQLAYQQKLTVSIPDLLSSFSHMHVNRLMRASQRAHEFVFYDFLFQLYDSSISRKERNRFLAGLSQRS